MLLIIAAILLALWVFALVATYTVGGFIDVLLVVAAVLMLVQVAQGSMLI